MTPCTIDDVLYYTNHRGERVAPPETYETPTIDMRDVFTDPLLREILAELRVIRELLEKGSK